MSMTRDQLLKNIGDPSLLDERTLGELREILEEYPYFQSAHLLFVFNLQKQNNFRFATQLKTGAVYATDRSVLYRLLNPGPEKKHIPDHSLEIGVISHPEQTTSIELSDEGAEVLSEPAEPMPRSVNQDLKNQADLLNFDLPDNAYTLEGTETEAEKPLADLAKEISHHGTKSDHFKVPEQKASLIDRFIQDNPAFTVRPPEPSGIAEKINRQLDNAAEGDEYMTETLARIYVKQGLYQKAITAFRKLSVKYPEKSVYFARQIDEVTNLLNK